MAEDVESEARPFVIVLKGSSSVRLPQRAGIKLDLRTAHGEAEVRAQTHWVNSGFDHPVPREFWVDVRLNAMSIDEAIDEARVLGSNITPIVAFSANAEIGHIEPHIAFDATQGVTEREFVEYFLPDERGLLPPSREGDPNVIVATSDAVLRSPYGVSITIALAHYLSALRYYHVGGESLAVAHLFMAAEALRVPTLSAYCRSSGRSEDEIRTDEGHENRHHLLAWARRELIFAGDEHVYKAAKEASDGLEHGFRTVSEIRALAGSACDQTFTYLRKAVINLLDITPATRAALVKRFGTPADTQSLRKRVTGVLIGDGDRLAAPGREYPVMEWKSNIACFDIAETGSPRVSFKEHLTVRTAEGISFQLRSIELYGRGRQGTETEQGEIRVEARDETSARDDVLPLLDQLSIAVAACGPGENGADFPQPMADLLDLFNRTRGLYRASLALLHEGHPEEALVLARALLRDALRLREAAGADAQTRNSFAFGWRYDSARAIGGVLSQWASGESESAGYETRVVARQQEILQAASRFGVKVRSFSSTEDLLASLDDDDYEKIDQLAETIEQGWDTATGSRRRVTTSGLMLYDTAPDSWVYPFTAKYIGGSYLMAAEAALRLFEWEDVGGQLATCRRALENYEAKIGE
ncbi:MAG: hypothetical protein M3O70_06330 [Actinomycetota bacterium]|nr:hypothetical protein [Actinomycetota bacterium]